MLKLSNFLTLNNLLTNLLPCLIKSNFFHDNNKLIINQLDRPVKLEFGY
jgi:hypothetical protein